MSSVRIACLITDDFEDAEFERPYRAFVEDGHDVVLLGIHGGEVHGKRGDSSATISQQVKGVASGDFDALFIPGGYSPDKLRGDDAPVHFVRDFAELDRPILAICHGPQLLASADAIGTRELTAWRTVQGDLLRMGFNVVDRDVVVDSGLVTSRGPADIDAFIDASLGALHQATAGTRASTPAP